MQLPLTFKIARRFIRSKHSNGFLSFISWMSMLGLVLGVATLVIITSVLNGFEHAMTSRVLGMVPQASIYLTDSESEWSSTAQTILASDNNIAGIAPVLQKRGMTSIQGDMHGTIINGIDPKQQNNVSILNHILVAGSLHSLRDNGNIILGKSLIEKHGLKVGDPITIMLVQPTKSVLGMTPSFHTFKIGGVFSASEKIDNWLSYVSLPDAKKLAGKDNATVGFRLKLHDVLKADSTVKQVVKHLQLNDDAYHARNWKQTHGGMYGSIEMNKIVISLLLFLVIIVSAFNLVSSLTMMITEKKYHIAILKTHGASPSFVFKVFMYQGLIICLVGTLLGVLFGLVVALNIEDISHWINTTFELNLFDHYIVTALPSQIKVLDVLFIMLASIIICVLAVIFPAKKATKIMPAQVLGGE